MTAIIQTEKLTKSYGAHRGDHRHRPRGRRGRGLRVPRPERRRQDDDDPDAPRPHPADAGRARVFGIETTVDPVAIHRRIGYLPGEFALYDKLTGGQTIEYFANLRGGVDPRYQADLIARLDIDPSRKFKEYSKGNKQKIGLIVALQHRPDLLILDEPTSGLDPLVQQTFYEVIREAKAEGRTIFLSSHILSRGREDLRPRRDHPRRPAGQGRPRRGAARPRPPPGRAAVRRRRAGRRVRRAARRERRHDRGQHPPDARLGLDRAGRPRSGATTSCSTSSAASRRSKRRSSPSTDAGRPRRPDMTSEVGRRPSPVAPAISGVSAPLPDLRIRQRLRQDDARLAPGDARRRRPAGRHPHRRQQRDRVRVRDARRRARASSTSSTPCRRSSRAWPASRSPSTRSAATSSTSTGRSSRSSPASGRSSPCRRRSPWRRAAAASSSSPRRR